MSHKNNFDSYIAPHYTTLQPVSKDTAANYSTELLTFLNQYPEFARSQSHLNFLQYCFDHYINCDPASRDLPIQEKLRRAGEMAINFMGIIGGAKG